MPRFAVIGLGAVGKVFSVLLKNSGVEVFLVEKEKAIRNELEKKEHLISGAYSGKAIFEKIYPSINSLSLSFPDIILLCTKTSSIESVLIELRTVIGSRDAVIISCQNGIGIEDLMEKVFGRKRTMRMVLNMGCSKISPNETKVHFAFTHFISMNERQKPTVDEICSFFIKAGMKVEIKRDYKSEVFKKAILNSAMSTICAITGFTMKKVMDSPELSSLVREVINEAIKVGKVQGLNIEEDFEKSAINYLSKGGDHKPSMLIDIEKRQKTENEFHCGQILRMATINGIETPTIHTLYYLLSAIEKNL